MTKASTPTSNLRATVYCALFIALIITGAYISIPIPIGPVPIVLADFFVMVTGLFMSFKYGVLSVGLYLSLGVLGIPVFSGGNSGLTALFGPTGGFLFGYLPLVMTIGFMTSKLKSSFITDLSALLLGNVLLYGFGILWLKISLSMDGSTALAVGLVPFIPGAVIKIIVVLALGRMFLPRFKEDIAGR